MVSMSHRIISPIAIKPCAFAGVEWIDDDRLMLASDRAKADQPYICTARDQSVHIMVLPHGHRKGGHAPAKAEL